MTVEALNTPVTTPVLYTTVATPLLELLHVPPPPAILLLNETDCPIHTVVVPDKVPVAYTVTPLVVLQPATVVKVIVTEPAETPPTVPLELLTVTTLATSTLLLLHVPPPGVPLVSVMDCPWQTPVGVLDIASNGLTVTGKLLITPEG